MTSPLPQRKQIAKSVTVAFPQEFLRRRVLATLFLLLVSLLLFVASHAQTTTSTMVITEIITDYGGYWKSNKSTLNPIKPDNSHNLLSFNFNGGRYSTGVNDSLLKAHGDKYVPGDYRAIPVHSIAGSVTSNTKIGLGAMYDGVYNGASAVKPENNMPKYLSDGKNGLDFGTCVANIPQGVVTNAVNNLNNKLVNDNIPDLLVTQVADPATNGLDVYEFADAYGNRIGNSVTIVIANLHFLGNWTADFYEASQTPMTLQSGFTQTDRPIRLWAADFSAFGIDSTNISQVAYFRMNLNGNSDIAFVAYNNSALQAVSLLPSTVDYFKGSTANGNVYLNWQTLQEQNSDRFEIQCSYDGVTFKTIDQVKAADFSTKPRSYNYTHINAGNGKIYYRLKMMDKSNAFTYSSVIMVNVVNNEAAKVNVYPNPATSKLVVKHTLAGGQEICTVRTIHGASVLQKTVKAGTVQTELDVQSLPAGSYVVVLANGSEQLSQIFVKK